MKRLIMIAGPAGVGKTTVCRELFHMMDRCAWLDADWCWMVHPWHPKSDEQKRYVERAFGYILDGYLDDEGTDCVLFSWLMHSDFMFDLVTGQLQHKSYGLHKFALVCEDQGVYADRMRAGGRRSEQVDHPEAMDRYRLLNAHIIDVSRLSPRQVAQKILDKSGGEPQ